ncbi:MAG: hypothetical protein ACRD0C_00715 [Acidimicrobiia bacterium]
MHPFPERRNCGDRKVPCWLKDEDDHGGPDVFGIQVVGHPVGVRSAVIRLMPPLRCQTWSSTDGPVRLSLEQGGGPIDWGADDSHQFAVSPSGQGIYDCAGNPA